MTQTLGLNDALYNAGLWGFLRVMKTIDPSFSIPEGTELNIDTAVFENETFSKAYIATALDCYQDQTKYQALLNLIYPYVTGEYKVTDSSDKESKTAYKDMVAQVKDKLNSASYKAAYEIIAKDPQAPFDFLPLIQQWKSEKSIDQQLQHLKLLNERLRQYRDVFAFKDVIYNFIQPYWSGVSFLEKTKNKSPFVPSFEEYFVQPVLKYKPARGKKRYHCLQCDRVLPSSPSNASMSWINDVGVDIKRKTNGFWNFNIDFAPCPLCNLVYACIPLGFQTVGYEGVFVNASSSFEAIERLNGKIAVTDTRQGSFAAMLNTFLADVNQQEAQRKIENIQVVRRFRSENGEWNYRVNIFSSAMLSRLVQCKEHLHWLAQTNPVIHRMVFNDLLEGKSLYPLLYRQYRKALKENYGFYLYSRVLQVQITMFSNNVRGDIKMTYSNVKKAQQEGIKLQQEIERRVNDKKSVTLSYGLLNALQTGDSNQFLQLVMRRYLSLGLEIPEVFIQAIYDEDTFQAIGNAFLIGLNQKDSGHANKENQEQ